MLPMIMIDILIRCEGVAGIDDGTDARMWPPAVCYAVTARNMSIGGIQSTRRSAAVRGQRRRSQREPAIRVVQAVRRQREPPPNHEPPAHDPRTRSVASAFQ